MANVKHVTDASFSNDVLQADQPVLVDFWAPWCGPCRAVAPVLDEVAQSYAGRVTVAKLNVDENQQVAGAYGIRSIPAIALFVGGEVVDGVLGAAPANLFTEMLDKHLEAAPAQEA
jgi:thioredoxin 1